MVTNATGVGGAQNGMEELQLLQELQFWTEVSPEQSPGAGENQARQTPWGKETQSSGDGAYLVNKSKLRQESTD